MSTIHPPSSNGGSVHKDKYSQPNFVNSRERGVAAMMLSCFTPDLRSSPTNFEESGVRGSNVWSERDSSKTYQRQCTSDIQRRQHLILGCHAEGGQASGRPPRPFASNPLLDRNDSLVQEGSFLSLVASECETKRSFDEEVPSTPQTAFRQNRKPKPFESSPLIGRDDSLVQGGSLLSLIASQDETLNYEKDAMVPSTPQVSYAKYDSCVLQTPSGDISSASFQPMHAPPSPALELSMARQQASQVMSKLNMRREVSRGSLFPKVDSVVSSSSIAKSTKGLPMHSPPLEKKSASGSVCELDNGASVSSRSLSVHDTLAVTPPVWREQDNIHSELKGTYQYPRLFANDPAIDIGQSSLPWWYFLSKKMDTTLSHVFEPYWREMESQQQNECWANNTSADTMSNDSGQLIMENNPYNSDKIVDFSSNNSPQRPRQLKHHGNSSSCFGNLSIENVSEISPVNSWSEPMASTMKVRGSSYAQDGIKVESDTALFACLGVDSFVSAEKEEKECSNASHYLDRWRQGCCDVGLDKPPFLLVINFVVPWGNFQSYSFRPDADDGPFSSKHKDRPSEQAWRAFMEGGTEHRNKCLKLIPRVCAGPWMVKKMVGSTPALIGTKLPVTYRGSIQENFLEITMDVTKGPAFGNTVANTVVGKADVVTVDLGFVIEGQEDSHTLPEQMLSCIRLHHLEMKKAPTIGQWRNMVANIR